MLWDDCEPKLSFRPARFSNSPAPRCLANMRESVSSLASGRHSAFSGSLRTRIPVLKIARSSQPLAGGLNPVAIVCGHRHGFTRLLRTPAAPTGAFALAANPQAPQPGFFPGFMGEVRVFTFAPGQFSPDDLLLNQGRVATLPASGLASDSATLNGSASSFGLPTTVWFEGSLRSRPRERSKPT